MTIVFYTHHTAGDTRSNASLFYRLFDAASRNMPDHQFLLFAPPSEKNSFTLNQNSSFAALPSLASYRFTGFIWRFLYLSSFLKKVKPDLVIHTQREIIRQLTGSQFYFIDPCNSQTDAGFSVKLKSLTKFFRENISNQKKIRLIFLSAYLKNNLINNIPPIEKYTFLVHPFPEKFFTKQEEEKRDQQKKILAEDCEYFYCPDALIIKENLLTLLKAFSVFKKRLKSNMKLVLTGTVADYKKNAETLLASYRFNKEVFYYTESGKNQRADILSSSFLEVCFKNEEQSLLPQTEAMHCEVPCVVPDTPISREIGGDACLYFQPADYPDLSQKLILLYNDENLRNNLIRAAESRKTVYSESCAINQLREAIVSVTDNE